MSRLFFALPLLAVICSALDSRDLYPHTENAVYLDQADDASSEQIDLQTPVRFLTKTYNRAWVLTNGFVSFEGPDLYMREDIEGLPTSTAILAPFYADVDISSSGSIIYEQSQDERLLDRAENVIREMFYRKERPTSLLIVTWRDVPGYKQNENQGMGNTFQLVVMTNGYWSYCLFNYPDRGINWLSTPGKYSYKDSVYGKTGLMFDVEGFRSDWYFPNSASEDIRTVVSYSTKQTPGVYLYKIGGHEIKVIEWYVQGPPATSQPDYTDTNDQKDRGVDDFEDEQLMTTTSRPHDRTTNDQRCHECRVGELFDGRNCILLGEVYSGNGNGTGSVNGEALYEFHVQVSGTLRGGQLQMVLGGRSDYRQQYLALQQVFPLTAGFAMMYPEGDIPGLASFVSNGRLTYQTTMRFSSGEQARTRVEMRSFSLDAMLGYHVTLTMEGDVPAARENDQVQVQDYELDFRPVGGNRLESGTARIDYSVGSERRQVDVYHFVEFTPHPAPSCDSLSEFRLTFRGVSVYLTDTMISFQHDTQISRLGDGGVPKFDCNEADICHEFASCEYNNGNYECVCNEGYSGDGLDCEDAGATESGCDSCHAEARCELDVDTFAQRCICRAGYTGDGRYCERLAETTEPPHPCEAARCGTNAYCMPLSQYEHRCVCEDGYTGDGYNCARDGSSVDQCDYARCHQDAMCEVNERNEAECTCKSGFVGNGYTCASLPEPDCRTNPSMCSESASCTLQNGRYTCRCNYGYEGDGRYCTWTPPAQADSLMYVHSLYLGELSLDSEGDTGESKQYFYDREAFYVAVAQDCDTKDFYVADVKTKAIYSMNGDSGEKKLVADGFGQVEGLAIDSTDKKLYIADKSKGEISVLDLNTDKRVVILNDVGYPRGLAIDTREGYIYWTSWLPENPSIERAELDGSNREVITNDVELPNHMTYDSRRQELCWVDAGKKTIECMGIDGGGRRLISDNVAVDGRRSWPFGLAKVDSTFYFTDWGYKRQLRSVDEKGNFETLDYGTTGGRKYNIITLQKSCDLQRTACTRDNGGCPGICVPKPANQHACLCPSDEPDCNNSSKKHRRRFFF